MSGTGHRLQSRSNLGQNSAYFQSIDDMEERFRRNQRTAQSQPSSSSGQSSIRRSPHRLSSQSQSRFMDRPFGQSYGHFGEDQNQSGRQRSQSSLGRAYAPGYGPFAQPMPPRTRFQSGLGTRSPQSRMGHTVSPSFCRSEVNPVLNRFERSQNRSYGQLVERRSPMIAQNRYYGRDPNTRNQFQNAIYAPHNLYRSPIARPGVLGSPYQQRSTIGPVRSSRSGSVPRSHPYQRPNLGKYVKLMPSISQSRRSAFHSDRPQCSSQ